MIRFQRLPRPLLDAWLVAHGVEKVHTDYRLRLWREDRAAFGPILESLIAYVDEALADVRTRIRRGFDDALSPFRTPSQDPAANYPALLHQVTLNGYFGEILAVIAVEHWGAHDFEDWLVPALLFRFHDQEFQHLDSINERLRRKEDFDPDATSERRPGRTGDDALAFRMNDDDEITDVLVVEAKCLTRSNGDRIREAYQKLSTAEVLPSGVRELINLLEDYDTPEAKKWQVALLRFWSEGHTKARRYDALAYACGQKPKRSRTWLPADKPHRAYVVRRDLEALEFHFEDLLAVVRAVFRRDSRGN